MNAATDQISIRVEHQLKLDAESVLEKLGLKISDAVRILLNQIRLTQSLPLKVRLPNKIDLALAEIERGEVETFTFDEFKKQIEDLKKC